MRPHATIELPPDVLGAFNDTDADANGGERDDRPPKDELKASGLGFKG